MPPRVQFIVERNDFARLATALPIAALDIIEEAVIEIEAAYRRDVHVDTSQLANSIYSEVAMEGGIAVGGVGATAEHAPYEEYGTGAEGAGYSFPGKPEGIPYSGGWVGRPGHPALTPAVEHERMNLQRRWGSLERRLGR